MKRLILLVGCLLGAHVLKAQRLVPVKDSLNFAVATELIGTSAEAMFYNPGPYVVNIEDVDLFEVYRNLPFTVIDSAFTVLPGDTLKVLIDFLPEHNITHDMALVLKSNAGFGHQVVRLTGQGRFSNSYYNSTENKSEQQLKTALTTKLGQGFSSLGYNSARDQMFMVLDNRKVNGQGATVNTLECIYTGTVITGYADRQAAQNGSPQFNTEHTFPQGKFNSNEPMKSDLHHLYPTTNTSNSQRGNDPFGNVTNASWSQGGSKSGGGIFEPRDVQKGATARSMMYFVLRYQDYGNFFQGQETILRNWHTAFPPDSIEQNRNDAIYALQNNRNPFVDYPQFIERIPSLVSNLTPADLVKLYSSDDTIKLAAAAGRHVFNYVLYNDGNKAINLSNFSLSDTSLHFVNTINSVSLQPQESVVVPISFNGANKYLASLDYMTNVAGQVNTSIPIISGEVPQVSLNEEKETTQMDVYPNPANQKLQILSKDKVKRVLLMDIMGANRREVSMLSGNTVDVTDVPSGIYILQVETTESKTRYRRVMISH